MNLRNYTTLGLAAALGCSSPTAPEEDAQFDDISVDAGAPEEDTTPSFPDAQPSFDTGKQPDIGPECTQVTLYVGQTYGGIHAAIATLEADGHIKNPKILQPQKVTPLNDVTEHYYQACIGQEEVIIAHTNPAPKVTATSPNSWAQVPKLSEFIECKRAEQTELGGGGFQDVPSEFERWVFAGVPISDQEWFCIGDWPKN